MANSGIVKTWDAKQLIITFIGTIFTDFSDGDVVTISTEDDFEYIEGADGSENRVNKNKNGANVDITISKASITNDALSALHLTDRTSNQGKGALSIVDLNGTSILYSAQAYIKKYADWTDGDSLGSRTWNLRAPQATILIGGNL